MNIHFISLVMIIGEFILYRILFCARQITWPDLQKSRYYFM